MESGRNMPSRTRRMVRGVAMRTTGEEADVDEEGRQAMSWEGDIAARTSPGQVRSSKSVVERKLVGKTRRFLVQETSRPRHE